MNSESAVSGEFQRSFRLTPIDAFRVVLARLSEEPYQLRQSRFFDRFQGMSRFDPQETITLDPYSYVTLEGEKVGVPRRTVKLLDYIFDVAVDKDHTDPIDVAVDLVNYATRNLKDNDSRRVNPFSSRSTLREAFNGTANCLEVCQILKDYFESIGKKTIQIHYWEKNMLPHFATYLPEDNKIVHYKGHVIKAKTLSRYISRFFRRQSR